MKRVFFIICFLITFCYSYAELVVTLVVESPGSLPSLIASSKKSEITSLTLIGALNGSDIKYIREMAGAGYKSTIPSNKCALNYLDLSSASIVSGGDYYAFEHYSSSAGVLYSDIKYYTETNAITPFMFDDCYKLKTLLLPNSVTKIYANAFWSCELSSITLPSNLESYECTIPSGCLTEINIDSNNTNFSIINGILYSADMKVLYRCPVNYPNPLFRIPEGVERISASAFYSCRQIKNFEIPTSLKVFDKGSLGFMELDKFVIYPTIQYMQPGNFTYIEEVEIKEGFTNFDAKSVFGGGSPGTYTAKNEIKAANVIVNSQSPPIIEQWHSFNNATLAGNLYVPRGAYSAYYIAFGWGDFSHIYEMDEGENDKKCKKPTIGYSKGKLTFNCETEGVTYNSTITNPDISSYNSDEVQLCLTYNISVYATRAGYEPSDIAYATLSWMDVAGDVNGDGKVNVSDVTALVNIILGIRQTDGINKFVSQVEMKPLLIQSDNGRIIVSGVPDRTLVYVCGIDGNQVGSAISNNGYANIETNLHPGNIAMVNISGKYFKVIIN